MQPKTLAKQDRKGSAEQGGLASLSRALCLIRGQDVMEEDTLKTLASPLTQ